VKSSVGPTPCPTRPEAPRDNHDRVHDRDEK
jgi:hypothetical protein